MYRYYQERLYRELPTGTAHWESLPVGWFVIIANGSEIWIISGDLLFVRRWIFLEDCDKELTYVSVSRRT